MSIISPPDHIYARIAPKDIAMFRYLLEASENLAQFSIIEKKAALLKIFFPKNNYHLLQKRLSEISQNIVFYWECY